MTTLLQSRPRALTLRIEDPSGETRRFPLSRKAVSTIGRSECADFRLKDPTLPVAVAELRQSEGDSSEIWIKLDETAECGHLSSIPIREAVLPLGVSLELGETRLTLEPLGEDSDLPSVPRSYRAWKTNSSSGAHLLWMTKKAAATPLSIYVAGETGTGKEVIASLVHAWSERASGPFVPLHCGALAPSLAESELFGHVKGAFTGANAHRTGALLQAHGGTLFLDEVGDLSMDLQVKLLRFLENGEIRPVGSDQIRHADVRVVCATHLPLRKLVEEGKFRRDLYYRLASVTLEIPSLRSRPEDISLLAREFAEDFGKTVAPKTLLRLQAYSWPGNVRELRHAIERACGLAGPFQSVLDERSFEFLLNGGNEDSDHAFVHGEIAEGMLTLFEMERVMLLRALKLSRGNRAEGAKILGVARSTLFEMLKRHGIEGPRAHLYRQKLRA